MATEKIRWPNNAEQARADSDQLAMLIEELGNEAIAQIRANPLACEVAIVHMMRHAAHIRRLLSEAKHGR